MNQAARHIIFSGRVQGVGFRFTTHSIAYRYDVSGYVRNRPDGTVEMFLQGSSQQVDTCLADIQDSFAGYIRETKVESVPSNARYTDFEIAF
ncbi:MAG: acylphosphatase [Sedimentisphaerales bacterium]|nr:acylphosphatase [Sedimentisphaerales bacterium]